MPYYAQDKLCAAPAKSVTFEKIALTSSLEGNAGVAVHKDKD